MIGSRTVGPDWRSEAEPILHPEALKSGFVARPDDAFVPSPSSEPPQPAQVTEAGTEITALLTELKRQDRITEVMSLNTLLNPVTEQVFDEPLTDEELLKDIVSQVNPAKVQEEEEEVEEFVEPVKPVSIRELIDLFQRVAVYEQQ
ncbi:hypothetical protein E4U16_006082 [Claviceps sp. LM84 group G4]|nr:hypothetical protein E4U16_006082 [Claviceps sp. LM84 group G4]